MCVYTILTLPSSDKEWHFILISIKTKDKHQKSKISVFDLAISCRMSVYSEPELLSISVSDLEA